MAFELHRVITAAVAVADSAPPAPLSLTGPVLRPARRRVRLT